MTKQTKQFEIIALTDVDEVFVQNTEKEGQVLVKKSITAWKRVGGRKVQEGLFELAAEVSYGRGRMYSLSLPSDAIIKVRVSKGPQGRLWMDNLPEPAQDKDLEKRLQEQVAEKTFEDEVLGHFVYDRMTCVYQCEMQWRGKTIVLEVEDAQAERPREVARKLQAEAEKWELAARAQVKTVKPAASRMSLGSVSIDHEGAFTFWFTGKAGIACAAGSLEEGITDATVI